MEIGYRPERDDFPFHARQSSDDEQEQYSRSMQRRFLTRRLPSRTRVLLYLVVAVGVILLPYGMLHVFEGMESRQGGLIIPVDDHSHDSIPDSPSRVSTTTEIPVASSTMSFVTSGEVATPSITRPDLPVRRLTSFVNPLIGTEGSGHGIPLSNVI